MATVNKTFRLHEDTVAILVRLAEEGARSQTSVVEELLRREERRRRRELREREREAEYAKAWADPEFRAEQEQITREFEPLDDEAWRITAARLDAGQ